MNDITTMSEVTLETVKQEAWDDPDFYEALCFDVDDALASKSWTLSTDDRAELDEALEEDVTFGDLGILTPSSARSGKPRPSRYWPRA